LKDAPAFIQQNRHVVGGGIGHDQVEPSVPVEIANGNCRRAQPGWVADFGSERAIAIAEQHHNASIGIVWWRTGVGYHEVQNAVTIDVTNCNRMWV
jgi:hypothetical protein